MTISEAAKALGAEIVQSEFLDCGLSEAYTSDLLSDVIANAVRTSGGALITIQAHINTVAVATLVGFSAIIICNSRPIPGDMIEAAKKEGIAILRVSENQFAVSGKLYSLFNN